MKKILNPNHTMVPRNFCRLPDGYGVIKIGVAGAASAGHCGLDAYEKAKELGREIARQGAIITTGATTGFPMYAAMGAKDECGFSIGFSPAANDREHVEVYGLPLDFMDVVIYTGFGYAGRDLLFTRSVDAMIIGCGRIGTMNEFAVAFEDRRPIGILEGSWKTDEIIKKIIDEAHRPNEKIIFDPDPKKLIGKVMAMVQNEKEGSRLVYNNHDSRSGTGKNVEVVL